VLARDPLLWISALVATAASAPFFRYVFWLGDEGVLLHGAARLLRGETIYRDFFEFLPPGGFLIVATWMRWIGPDFAAVRILAIAVIAAIAALTYASVRQVSGSRPLAALLAIGWAALSQGSWTVVSHHWLATAASLAAALALLGALPPPRAASRFFIAGLFAGTAAMIVSTRGAFLCLAVPAVVLTLGERRALMGVLAGIAVAPVATMAYLAATGSLALAVADVVLFPARHYSDIQVVAFGASSAPVELPATAFFPVTFLLAAALVIVGGAAATWRDPGFRAALALALVGLLGAFPRPDVTHINFTLPLACPLFALVATRLLGRLGRGLRVVIGASVVAACVLLIGYRYLGESLPLLARPLRPVQTARGTLVGRPGPWIDAVTALVPHVEGAPRDAAYFFYPYSPMLPYLTGRRHVAPLDVMVPGYTTAAQYQAVCERVVREAQWLVLDRSWSHPDVLRATFPSMRDPDPPEKRALERALDRGFDRVIHAFRGMELRGRGAAPADSLCRGR
jgi:hypothetical protein